MNQRKYMTCVHFKFITYDQTVLKANNRYSLYSNANKVQDIFLNSSTV